MELSNPIIQPFLDYLKFEKRYSRHTIISYQNDLESFFNYLSTQYGEMPLTEISHTLIRSWIASLKNAEQTSKTINRKISTLRSYFKYLVKTGVLQQTPMAKIIAPKNEKRLPQFVPGKDLEYLFQELQFPETWEGQAEKLILELFYQTGMRLSELITLQKHQVNFSGENVKVLGKGNKERILPVAKALLSSILSYQKNAPETYAGSGHLFQTSKGRALSPRKVYEIVNRYLSQVTTIEKKSPHVLRHSFATHLMNNGAELNAVKELLGHSSLAATQVYTHNTIDKLKNIYKKAHPRS